MAMDRNLGMDFVRATEAAALSAGRWVGKGDRHAVDQAACEAMRRALSDIDMRGVVVIGEGERDEAPMLYIGEELGTGNGYRVQIAVDPVEGTNLVANGMPRRYQCRRGCHRRGGTPAARTRHLHG
jgi:fructose-1,6-bisphosphatase II